MIGQLLAGHYKVLQVLGEGGFGQTYIVEDIHLPGHPKCVLKHLKPTSTDPEILQTSRRLFQKEAETLQHLGNHKQIPRLLAYFEEKQEFYLVQEFIEGHPLAKELPLGKKWTENQIIEMLMEVLGILEFVHSQGVIHRDIKPDNIIRCSEDNKLVLIDFGAIKQLRSQTAIASGQQNIAIAIGTPGYMPSEHTRPLPRPSSDIYAVGMIGIQALTGVNPKKLKDDPNTGELLWQDLTPVSPGLAAVLTKMTHYHFKDRYQTTTEALLALQELINPGDDSTLKARVAATTLHEIILEWQEAGQIKTRTILEKQQSKSFGKVRIGRDPEECDIVLSDPTVSGLHVEIFFHSERQQFYLRNLRQKNPAIVDGQLLLAGEMPLSSSSSLRLGQQKLRVSAITQKQFPAGYTPIDYATYYENTPQQVLAKTARIAKAETSLANLTPVVPPTLAPASLFAQKLPLFLGLGMASVATAISGFAFFNGDNLIGAHSQQNLISQKPQLCRIVVPTNRDSAKLRPHPQREVDAFKQLNKGDLVLFIQAQGDFVEVKLADGTQGWIFGNQIQPCNASGVSNQTFTSNKYKAK